MMRLGRLRQLRDSLLFRYLLIIVSAVLLLPVVISLAIIAYVLINNFNEPSRPADYVKYASVFELSKMWHREALELSGASAEKMDSRLRELGKEYIRASMFWVDGNGEIRLILEPVQATPGSQTTELPASWTAAESIAFMKESINGDPLTIVAFIGDRAEAREGFMVFQVPRDVLQRTNEEGISLRFIFILLALFAGFAVISWMFFSGIRRRLLRLQHAMATRGRNGVPDYILRGRPDEIGRLEEAFNAMVAELAASRQREVEENDLRTRLVADLSHDLRTPLTVIRSHLHVITKEVLSPEGQKSLKLMDERISNLGTLIENLLSYNLLHSGRIILNPQRKDVIRLLRESAAAWYPLWEKEGFKACIELDDDDPLWWEVDEVWFRRILDNLFQNIVRHAHDGRYVGIAVLSVNGTRSVVISDRGQGIAGSSPAKGAGLGLSIVDLLLKQMKLGWRIESTEEGTQVILFEPHPPFLNQN